MRAARALLIPFSFRASYVFGFLTDGDAFLPGMWRLSDIDAITSIVTKGDRPLGAVVLAVIGRDAAGDDHRPARLGAARDRHPRREAAARAGRRGRLERPLPRLLDQEDRVLPGRIESAAVHLHDPSDAGPRVAHG